MTGSRGLALQLPGRPPVGTHAVWRGDEPRRRGRRVRRGSCFGSFGDACEPGGEASAGVERGLEAAGGAVVLGGEPLASGVLVLFVGFLAAGREEGSCGDGDEHYGENESDAHLHDVERTLGWATVWIIPLVDETPETAVRLIERLTGRGGLRPLDSGVLPRIR
jgi:hypothetical protein